MIPVKIFFQLFLLPPTPPCVDIRKFLESYQILELIAEISAQKKVFNYWVIQVFCLQF